MPADWSGGRSALQLESTPHWLCLRLTCSWEPASSLGTVAPLPAHRVLLSLSMMVVVV